MKRWNVIALSAFLAAISAGALAYEETTETRLKVETQRAAPAPQPPPSVEQKNTAESKTVVDENGRVQEQKTYEQRTVRQEPPPPPAPPAVVEKKSVEVYRESD